MAYLQRTINVWGCTSSTYHKRFGAAVLAMGVGRGEYFETFNKKGCFLSF